MACINNQTRQREYDTMKTDEELASELAILYFDGSRQGEIGKKATDLIGPLHPDKQKLIIRRALEIVLERETWVLIWIPVCCGCNGHEGRPDDPWECYSTSSKGHIWFHRSCLLRAFPEEARPPDDWASPL
jgi:hypothetical protein